MENRRSQSFVVSSPNHLRYLVEPQEFEQSKRTSDRSILIAPNRQTLPLPLSQHEIALLQHNHPFSQPIFDQLDLPGMFSNRKASQDQIDDLHKPKGLLVFDPFQTPLKKCEHPAIPGLRRVTLLQGGGSSLEKLPQKKTRPRQKGLRRLSHRAYDIVIAMRSASYKEVANRLVAQMSRQRELDKEGKEQQNIKRRVYDALNVLIALGVLRKDNKKIVADRRRLPKLNQQPAQLAENIETQEQTLQDKKKRVEELRQMSESMRGFLTSKKQAFSNKESKIALPFFYIQLDSCDMQVHKEKAEFRQFNDSSEPQQIDLQWLSRNLSSFGKPENDL